MIEPRDRERRSAFQWQDGDKPVGAVGHSRACLSEFLLWNKMSEPRSTLDPESPPQWPRQTTPHLPISTEVAVTKCSSRTFFILIFPKSKGSHTSGLHEEVLTLLSVIVCCSHIVNSSMPGFWKDKNNDNTKFYLNRAKWRQNELIRSCNAGPYAEDSWSSGQWGCLLNSTWYEHAHTCFNPAWPVRRRSYPVCGCMHAHDNNWKDEIQAFSNNKIQAQYI